MRVANDTNPIIAKKVTVIQLNNNTKLIYSNEILEDSSPLVNF